MSQTIADQLRSLAKHNEANIVLANDLERLAKQLDEKADELVSVGRTHCACELAATLGGKGYNRDITVPDQRPKNWRASVREHDGTLKHFYGATADAVDAQRSTYLRVANQNTDQAGG